MSKTIYWRYRLAEREERALRIEGFKKSIGLALSKWDALDRRAHDLDIVETLEGDKEWGKIKQSIEMLRAEASSLLANAGKDIEERLRVTQEQIEDFLDRADKVVNRAFEKKLEQQRKEVAAKSALSTMEALKNAFIAFSSNELVRKWENEALREYENKIQEIAQLFQQEMYEEVRDKCGRLNTEITELAKRAEENEQKYNEATRVKDMIKNVLENLGFTVKIQETRNGAQFQGYTVIAEDFIGRGVKTEIGADRSVKDTFCNFEGETCHLTAEKYAEMLIKMFDIKMEDVVEDPPRGRPQIIEKDEIQGPRDSGTERQSD